MSVYEELCEAYLDSRENLEECRNHCVAQYEAIVNHLIQRIEIPDGAVRYINLHEEASPAVYTLPGAITLGGDGFWHLGLVITFHKEGTTPTFQLLFDIHLQAVNHGFLVKLTSDEPGYVLHPDNKRELDTFADHFSENVRAWFRTYTERVLSPDEEVYEAHGAYL